MDEQEKNDLYPHRFRNVLQFTREEEPKQRAGQDLRRLK
jgi:hypothetical protein